MAVLAGLDDFARGGLTSEECRANARAAAGAAEPGVRAGIELDLAQGLHRRGRMGEARDLLRSALPDVDDAVRPYVLYLLADVWRISGETELALETVDEAESLLSDEVEFHQYLRPSILGLRGMVHLELGVLDEAARWIEQETELAEGIGDPELVRTALIHRASLLLANYREDAIGRATREELERETEVGTHPAGRAVLRSLLGRARADRALALATGIEEARRDLERALDDEALGIEDEIATRIALARVLRAMGDTGPARDELERAGARVDELFGGLKASSRVRERGLLAAEACELELAVSGAVTETAFAELEDAWHAFLEQWRRTPIRPGGIGFLHFHERLVVMDVLVRAELARAPGEAGVRAALERVMEAQALGTLSRSLDLGPGTVDELRAILGPGDGVLVYVPSLERSHVFALDRERIASFELSPSLELERLQREFQAIVETPPALRGSRGEVELARSGSETAAVFLPPDVRALVDGWERVTIVGAGFFGDLPFESLPLSDGRVGLLHAVSYLPSISLGLYLEALSADREETEHELLLATASRPASALRERWPELAPLAIDSGRLMQIARAYGESRIVSDVSAEELERLLALRPRVLQLVAHGVHDVRRERSALLVLAAAGGDSGVVTCDRVESWRAPPLVVLTACGAARGPARLGDDGLSNLGGAFLRAGAEAVVLSRADQELESALSFSEGFHEALREGAATADALLHARRRVAREPRFSDPFYHSLVHAVGWANTPLFEGTWSTDGESRGSGWLPLGLALFLLALLGRELAPVRDVTRPSGS